MAEDPAPRRLAAILAADVVGYSRLMERDEAGTLALLKSRRKSVLEPLVAKHRGRVFKVVGDGVLIEFASPVNALQCAIELQQEMASANHDLAEDRQILLRIGVNLGDVMVEGGDLYGDGVNIAARLEGMAESGAVCLSDDVYRQVRGKLPFEFQDLGERQLKNIATPVHTYCIRPGKLAVSRPSLSLPDRPSIAVLPFQNMSGDPEQEYFADGMVEEIITALSRMRWLFVIARNSSFTYKGRAVDVKQVGRELGVRYVLEGSVRKAGDKLRITGQLIDSASGAHLWADRFDGTLADIFDLQDHVTGNVVGAIAPKLEQAEIERAKRKPTESLDAYDYYLRGLTAVHQWTETGSNEALGHFRKAIELDPNFAAAYGMAARCYSQRKVSNWIKDRKREVAEAERLALRAAELGRDDAIALATAGMALAYVVGALDDGNALVERSLALNPNLASAWMFSGWIKVWLGEPELAIEHAARAMRLSPQDPQMFNMLTVTAMAQFFAGRYREAATSAEAAIRLQPNSLHSVLVAAASNGLQGLTTEAARAAARLRQIAPDLRIADLKDLFPIRQADSLERWLLGLRKAELPE